MRRAAFLMPQLAFSRHFAPAHIERLAALCDLVSAEPFAAPSLCRDAEIVVTGWGSPHLSASEALPNLRLVAHAAGTLKHTLDPGLLARGVRATSAAQANAEPVAEFSLSWILRWNKQLDRMERDYRRDRGAYEFRQGTEDLGNYDVTVGIVSASHVGRALLRLLAPFRINCLLFDPFVSEKDAHDAGARKVDLPELLASSDIVSLNTPLLPATEGMIGAAEFAQMRNGALFINTARGRIVDHDALTAACASRRISAVLDVTEPEPLPTEHPLWELENVWITPHVAGSLGREIRRMTDWCLDEIERFVTGQPLRSEISTANWERAA